MIVQDALPFDVFETRALPGMKPLGDAPWLVQDEAYGGQMAERRRLISEHQDAVHRLLPEAHAPARELLDLTLDTLAAADGFTVSTTHVRGPDGYETPIDPAHPLLTLGALVQEDLCILTKAEAASEHCLTGAIVCFPASWTLAEKIGHPLSIIHEPVAEYGPVQNRVQRLFDGVQVGRPLTRFNKLWYADPALFQPRSAHDRRPERFAKRADYLRSEHQIVMRLPKTKAVVFVIHTYVVPRSKLSGDPLENEA